MNIMTGSDIKPENEDDEVIEMCKGIQGLIDEGIVQGCDKQKNKDFENVTLSIMELQNVSREDAEKQARLLLKMD